MAARSPNLNVDSVGSNPKRTLRGSWTPANVKNLLQDLYIESQLATFGATNLRQTSTTQALKMLHWSTPSKKRVKQYEKCKDQYILAYLKVYATFANLQHMVKPAIKVHN